jgi:DNA-binding transcriptional MerR regulator
MRIGELAALAGVTTRTVRHYHHTGLLREPARRGNGYRAYTLRDAVELTRIRRLTELGLSLDEVKDVLAEDAGKDLPEVLAELDEGLAQQEEEIRRRRARLAELLRQAEDGNGLPPEGPVSPDLAGLFGEMARTAEQLPGAEPAMAAKERELMALLDGAASEGAESWLTAMAGSLATDETAMRRAYEIYARMDELADAEPDDPRVAEVAEAMADAMPEGAFRPGQIPESPEDGLTEAFLADYPPAQAEAIRQAMALLASRARAGTQDDTGTGAAGAAE